MQKPNLKSKENPAVIQRSLNWNGDESSIAYDKETIRHNLRNLNNPVFAIEKNGKIGLTNTGTITVSSNGIGDLAGMVWPVNASDFGDPGFLSTYGVQAAYYAGGMANAIASEELVTALGQAGLMGCFGSGGLSPARLSTAIDTIQAELGNAPYMFNLLHNPFEPSAEQATVDLLLEKDVRVVEAAAYINLTSPLVEYRVRGFSMGENGTPQICNRVIAKISRKEVAMRFLQPAPEKILQELLANGKVTKSQAEMARSLPVADDITVEADSGGHTDNQPLVALLPSIIALRDQTQSQNQYDQPVRIGAAGGISTPGAVLGAFMMGAAYVVTGSVNQACVESGASDHTKQLLSQADMADVTMAPSADMFEMGARVQVLKKGCMFPMRAQKLYDLYTAYASLEDIPEEIRLELEEKIFKRRIDDIWADTVSFFEQRDPSQIEKARKIPKKKMALVFRWYLGLASRWSRDGDKDRRMDYQIWCGPSMGAFNEWAAGTYMEKPENRKVADVAWQLMNGCAYLSRVRALKLQGVPVAPDLEMYVPTPLDF